MLSIVDDQTFIIYDHTVLQREEDDLKDAIIYFYPPSVSVNTQCGICGQLMGMVDLFKNLMGSPPSLLKLQTIKFAVKHLGQYSMALAATLSCPDGILSAQLDHLHRLFCFYHKSLPAFYRRADSAVVQQDVWSGHVQFVRHYGHSVSASFMSQPYTDTPQGKGQMIHLQAKHLLQHCEQHFHVFSGSVFYKNSVLTTQLSTDLTSRLLIIRPQQFSSQRSDETPYPDGIHILPVYLTQEEFATVLQNSTYKPPKYFSQKDQKTHGIFTTCPNSDDPVSSSEDNLPSPINIVNTASADVNENKETDTMPRDEQDISGIISASVGTDTTVDTSSASVQSSSTPIASSSDSALEDQADQGHLSLIRQPLVVTSDPIQIMENIKAVAARGSEAFSRAAVGAKKIPGPQSIGQKEDVMDKELKASSSVDANNCGAKTSSGEIKEMVKFEGVGKEGLKGCGEEVKEIVKDEDVDKEISKASSEDVQKSETVEDIDNTENMTVKEKSQETEQVQMLKDSVERSHEGRSDESKESSKTEEEHEGELNSSQTTSACSVATDNEHSGDKTQQTVVSGQSVVENKLAVTDLNMEGLAEDDSKAKDIVKEDILHIEKSVNRSLNIGTVIQQKDVDYSKEDDHEKEDSSDEDQTNSQCPKHGDHDAVKENVKQAHTVGSNFVSLELYVQNNSEMVILLLMAKGSRKNPTLISSMWKSILPQLAALEANLQMCPKTQQTKQQEALASYQYLQYNSLKKSLSGRIALAEEDSQPASPEDSDFCQNAVFIHDANSHNSRLKELVMRKAGSIVYGHRLGSEESFFQRTMTAKTTGAPSEKDATMQINRKIKEKLYKDQQISLL